MVPSRSQAISRSHSTSRAWLDGEQMLAAILDPLHRPADKARRERNQEILRIEFAAHAEAAADVVLDHADGLLRQAQLLRQNAAVGERHLGCAVHGELCPRRVPVGHKPARLHHHRSEALDLEVLAPRIGRGLERSFRVTFDCRERAGEVGARPPRRRAPRRARAVSRSAMTGRLSISTSITSSASSASAWESAITTAIGSPT